MGEVTAVVFRDGQVVDHMALEAIAPRDGESEFIWIEVLDPADSDLALLQERFRLHGLAIDDSMGAMQVPKVNLYDDQIFVALKVARLDGDEIKYADVDAFVSGRHIITVRHGAGAGSAQTREKLQSGPRYSRLGPDFVLHAVMESVVESYYPVVQMVEEEVLSMEQMFLDEFLGRGEVRRLFQLRREALHLQYMLTRMSDVCGKLTNLAVPCIGSEVKPYFRDVHDHLLRLDGMVRGLVEVIRAVFEASNLLEQQRQGTITRQLAAWAAILGVPTVIAGIYGMGAPHVPGPAARLVYLLAVGMTLLACLVLYFRFRKLRWL